MRKRLTLPLLLVLGMTLAVPASSQAFVTGLGDQLPFKMFPTTAFRVLHVKYVRYFPPYDAMTFGTARDNAKSFIDLAQKSGAQVLIAFYHSQTRPTHIPSVKEYTKDVKAFMKAFPSVKYYTPWNEANRGNVNQGSAKFHSPSARQSAAFYEALRKSCRGCHIVGLDVLDSNRISSTLRYIRDFKRAVRHMPSIWGLHNYSDTNRFHNSGTKAVARIVPGQLWLTETGGLVRFGGAFPNRHGEGLKRAAKALKYMFKLAGSDHKIKRLYIYNWSPSSKDRFDAGLVNANGTVRPGYSVVRDYLRHHH